MTAFPVDPLPEIDGFSSLLAIWDGKRDGTLLPPKTAFGIEDFGAWVGRIAISEWEDGDCRFRLFGTQFVDLLERDLTGELLCETLMPDLVEPLKRHFAELRYGSRIGMRPVTSLSPTVNSSPSTFSICRYGMISRKSASFCTV